MAMYSLKPGLEISWEINLKRKSINITFKVQFEQEEPDTASVTSKNSGEVTSGRRTDIYLIEIPFTQLTEILVPASEDSNGPQRTFMIPLHDPPKFSRQLGDWTKSMKESGLTRWNIFDVWMRQTDIEFNMRAKQSRPVGLLHRKPVIDIGMYGFQQFNF